MKISRGNPNFSVFVITFPGKNKKVNLRMMLSQNTECACEVCLSAAFRSDEIKAAPEQHVRKTAIGGEASPVPRKHAPAAPTTA
jgi:hypothetical protein